VLGHWGDGALVQWGKNQRSNAPLLPCSNAPTPFLESLLSQNLTLKLMRMGVVIIVPQSSRSLVLCKKLSFSKKLSFCTMSTFFLNYDHGSSEKTTVCEKGNKK